MRLLHFSAMTVTALVMALLAVGFGGVNVNGLLAECPAATCPAPSWTQPVVPTTKTMPLPGASITQCWTDGLAYASDGLGLTYTCLQNPTQVWVVVKLYDQASPVYTTYAFPTPNGGRLAVVASVTVGQDFDGEVRDHVYWGGVNQISPFAVSTRVDILRFFGSTGTIGYTLPKYFEVASTRRILRAGAATCGPLSNKRAISMRAFGYDFGTNASPASQTDSTVVDWYDITVSSGSGGVYYDMLASMPGGANMTKRGYVTAASAGQHCVFAGGVTTANKYTNEISIWNANTNVWTKAALCTARTKMASAYIEDPTPSVGGIVIFAGGQLNTSIATSVVDIYNLNTQTSTTTCLPGGARWGATATVVMNRYVVIAGGFTSQSPMTASTAVDVYDVVTGGWTKLPNGLSSARAETPIGALTYPTYNSAFTNFGVMMAGGNNAVSTIMSIDVLSSLVYRKSGNLPESRFAAGSASWPSVSSNTNPDNFDGKAVISGGIGGPNADFFLDFITLNPGLDPTVSTNWVTISYPTISGYSEVGRRDNGAVIYPSTGAYKVLEFHGGQRSDGTSNDRQEVWLKTQVSGSFWITHTPLTAMINEAYATCYTNSFAAPGLVFSTRAFGRVFTGSKSPKSSIYWYERSNGTTSDSSQDWPLGVTAPARYDATGLGAGRYCLFAGGYANGNVKDTINVFDAYAPNTNSIKTSNYGFPIAAPITYGWTLSVARRWMAAAFLIQPQSLTVAGDTGYAIFAGGQIAGGYATDVIDTINTATAQTTSTLRLSVARRSLVAATAGRRFAVFAGGYNDATGNVLNTVDVFDVDLWQVTQLAPLSVARQQMATNTILLDAATQTYQVIFSGGCDYNGNPVSAVDTYTFVGAGLM